MTLHAGNDPLVAVPPLGVVNENYRLLFECNPQPMWVYDIETLRFLAVNDAAMCHYGYTRAEFLCMTIVQIRPPESVPALMAALAARNTHYVRNEEARHRKKSGELIDVEVAVHDVPFAGRNARMCLVNDVTERKRIEARLRDVDERFHQVVDHITKVFWILDVARREIVYVSPAFDEIWGLPSHDPSAVHRLWLEALHREDRPRIEMAQARRPVEEAFDQTYRIVRPDGRVRWIHDRGFPVRNAEGEVYRTVGIAEDITERRLLEEQFRQAQRMEALGTLAGGIAHDFNNILAAITGYTELAKLEVAENPRVKDILDSILKGTHRATDLVRRILSFSRRQELERKPLQLEPIVMEAVSLLRASISPTIQFDVSIGQQVPNVWADASQIHQVAMNLFTNAAYAMREGGGWLRVSIEPWTVDAVLAARHPELRPGQYVRLSIADTGEGMDDRTLARIFEPFFTTKPTGVGTGLGLAAVHGIVRSHDGAVTVESHPGEGTTFHLYFPATGESGTVPSGATGALARGAGQRILYVDDEVLLASMAKKLLERLGYIVDVFTNPVEAITALQDSERDYHVVITDQLMPVITGTALAEQVRLTRPGLPVILLTGYTGNLTEAQTKAIGIRKLLFKPISVAGLATAVAEVLA